MPTIFKQYKGRFRYANWSKVSELMVPKPDGTYSVSNTMIYGTAGESKKDPTSTFEKFWFSQIKEEWINPPQSKHNGTKGWIDQIMDAAYGVDNIDDQGKDVGSIKKFPNKFFN